MDKLLLKYSIKENLDFETFKSKIFKKFLTDKYFKGSIQDYFNYITNIEIVWKDTKTERSCEWWVKTAYVSGKPTFEMFCSKVVIKLFLLDLRNGTKIEVESISDGMRKVNQSTLL